ncbi:MAG: N-6 DNA methylase [Desulfurococcaceae archaeon]|nr:N-6 DNA methylase [Desulfurococcaceae archaeon]
MSSELPFTFELWRKLAEYLDKYLVAGRKLKAMPTNAVIYYGKKPDIVIVDDTGISQLIIETKRKSDEGKLEDVYEPLGEAVVAQALCYAALALKHHNLDRTPLFATANRDTIVIFKGIDREKLDEFVDIEKCKESHVSPEDWAKALKLSAYSKLLHQGYLLARLEKPLSEDTIKKLFEDHVAKWIIRAAITPAQLHRVLVDQLRYDVEKLHDEYVEDAVKIRVLKEPQYFKELHELATKQGYANGVLNPGILLLCPDEDRKSIEKVCRPLAEKIGKVLSKAKDPQQLFSLLTNMADKYVNELVEYCKEEVKQGRVPPIICSKKVKDAISFRNLSIMMTYALAAKILAYKVLELHYDIPKLTPLDTKSLRSSDDIVYTLNKFFEEIPKWVEEKLKVKDFTPIFKTGLYDKIVFKGLEAANRVNALIEIADAIKESLKLLPGIIGYVYEGFIPPRERHQLGQFYTPPAVARLIARWTIRSGSDKVLDGGCGSGTFLIEVYKRLLLLKFNKEYGKSYPTCRENINEHQEILDNLYGVDINAFATQLTSLHLMFMEPRCPFSRLNIEVRDFFSISQKGFDAVIGNPPYTRWVEIPEATKELIKSSVGDLMSRYDLVADIRRGREPGIYVYWILHATKNLLKNGGRLGMIISNTWLQTDYGIDFGRFLLDNFKIKALIDISYRLFEALISTVIVLAEKESDENARKNNEVLLVRVPPIDSKLSDKEVEAKVDEALKCIENAIAPNYEFDKTALEICRQRYGIWYRFVRQSEIPRDKKWISLFFERGEDIAKIIEAHPLMIRAGEWFKPSRGNSIWSIWALDHGKRPDLGAKDFFYFSRDKIAEWDAKVKGFREAVMKYLVPAITASRYVKTFTFTERDWMEIRDRKSRSRGKEKYLDAWILVLHEPREKIPQPLHEYIRWGETECRTEIRGTRGGGRICSEAEACRAREEAREEAEEGEESYFYGWYDLGGYIPALVMAIYHPRYHPQFFLVTVHPLITYGNMITFISRTKIIMKEFIYDPLEYNKNNIIDNVKSEITLDETEIKAILSYLNSTFNWIWLEQNAGYAAKGPLSIEVNVVEKMPILNIKKVDRRYVEELAQLFDKLESAARLIIGTDVSLSKESEEESEEEEEGGKKLRMFKELRPVFREIDSKIAEILGVSIDIDELWRYAWEMMERRIKGAGRKVAPGTEGVELATSAKEVKKSRKRGKKKDSQDKVVPLTKWFKQDSKVSDGEGEIK